MPGNDKQYMTVAACKEKYSHTKWTFVFLGGFFLLMLVAAGYAVAVASGVALQHGELEARCGAVETKQEALDQYLTRTLEQIQIDVREIRNRQAGNRNQ